MTAIRITGAGKPSYWYADKIGEVFTVIEELYPAMGGRYCVWHPKNISYVQHEDCVIISKEQAGIDDLVHEAHQNAIDKGWYEEPRTFGEMIALMHSELSEALEDHRNGYGYTEIYYEGEKPCGIPTELADVVIRIFDTCGHLGIDLEAAIAQKMAFNSTRSVRHGGKRL